jgi:protein O-GlcNAc transferase
MPSETAQSLFDQGNSLFSAGEREAAAESYRRALRLEPSFAQASFNLGCTLDLLEGPSQALPHFLQAARLRPDWFEARGNLGYALARIGRMAEAALELEAAALLKPGDAGVRNNLGLALSELNRGEQAHACFLEAIRLVPGYPEAHSNLAMLFERYGRTSEAISACREALRLRPDYPEAHQNLAGALKSQGRHEEALAHYREALRLKPDNGEAQSSLLFALCYPANLDEDQVLAEHLAFGAAHQLVPSPHDNDCAPDRVLRIGYVSADFRAHAVARFIEPVLKFADRSSFKIYCYSNVSVPDQKSAQLKEAADVFRNIAGVPDEAAEAMIRRDRIDILVDLSGHTAGNRLLLFARKPAPVQVSWLGYPHTTGLSCIDYRITDAVADPPGAAGRPGAEELLRLPGTFCCFAPPEEAPPVGEAPFLLTGAITFGSFNNPAKITPETVALWAGALHATAGSRMIVKGYSLADAGSRARLAGQFLANGVGPERLELLGNTASYSEHLRLYGKLDIALDTFPYHGTTTTCEALWMGVPVVTLAGGTHRSRVGASLLGSVGLGGLVARDPQGFADAATALAGDRERLVELRKSLRQRMAASPLSDGAAFTGHLEKAFRSIWRSRCTGSGTVSTVSEANPQECGARLLQQGKLDGALRSFLAELSVAPSPAAALGGIEETLNRLSTADLAEACSRDAARLGVGPAAIEREGILRETLEAAAEQLLTRGMVTPAELICRYLEDRGERSAALSRTQAGVALAIGQTTIAAGKFREAVGMGDDSLATRIRLLKAEESARLKPVVVESERFLVIKAWGYGFWSDVNHLLGQLLLAELTGRTPVVHWGGNSLFSDDPGENAFVNYFEPVSRHTLKELASGGRSYYPPKWSAENLARDGINQAQGPWSRSSSLYTLERPEDVVVSDYHYAVNDLAPWIPPDHRLHGRSTDELYRYLFGRYLVVKPWIAAKVEAFFRQRMAGKRLLALHVRGGDKVGEDPNLSKLNRLYHLEIGRELRQNPQTALYLLTDDAEILKDYLDRYRDRVIHTGATRTGTAQGVHYQRHASRYRLAEEVMVDTLLAARCDGFIGNGLSNVSCAVAQMKLWPPESCRLLGARLDRLRNFTLYRS